MIRTRLPLFMAVAWLVFTPMAPRLAVAADSFSDRTAIAFTDQGIATLDGGWTIGRLGMKPGRIYLIGSKRPYGDIMALPPRFFPVTVELSAPGDLVAFSGVMGESQLDRVSGVTVADTIGRILASFPGTVSHAWNRSGSELAVAYSPGDSGQIGIGGGILLWERSGQTTRTLPHWADAMAWGAGDTLFTSRNGDVMAVDVRSGRGYRSRHRSVLVSPDGRYSLVLPAPGQAPRVWDDILGEDLLGCSVDAIESALTDGGRVGEGSSPGGIIVFASKPGIRPAEPLRYKKALLASLSKPFWIQATGAGHILCVTAGQPELGRRGRQSVPRSFTLVIDVESATVLRTIEGRAIGMTADQKGILVLRRDDNLSIEEIVPLVAVEARSRTPNFSSSPTASMTIETVRVDRWRRFEDRVRVSGTTRHIRRHDRIPGFLPSDALCDRPFRILEVSGSGVVRVAFDATRFRVNEGNGATAKVGGKTRAELSVGHGGAVLKARESDGADYEVTLRVVP